jgi:O-antigen/teichoic acid export membrane protein
VIQATGLVLKYASQILLARWMDSVGEYSAFAIAFTWTQLLAVGAALGLTTAALRFIPEYVTKGEDARLVGFLGRSRQLVIAAGLVIAAAGTLMLMVVEDRPLQLSALRIGLWLVPLYALAELQMQSVRATRKVASAFLPSFVLQPIFLIAAALAWLEWRGELTAVSGVVSLVLAVAAVAVVQRFALVRAIPETIRNTAPEYETRRWLNVSVPLLLSAAFLMLMSNTDVILLGMMRGDGEAGIYFAASRTARQAAFMLAAVNAIVAPLISGQIAGGDRQRLQRLVHLAAAMVFIPSLVVAVVLLALNQWILGLFGTEYLAARNPLFVLVIGQLVNALTGPVGFLLSLGGHERSSTMVYGWCALMNIGLNALLIAQFGITGAAVATSFSLAVANLWLTVLVVRHLRIMPIPFLSLPRSARGES